MKKNIRHRQLFKLGLLFTLLLYSSHLFALDPTFMRNGEVYLSLSEAPSTSVLVNGIYRLSDPEGVLGGVLP